MIELDTLKIDPAFYKEEIRSGYTVTENRKEVWAVELDLLARLDQVCRENGLRYCVGAGTMLGAVRHSGFIPWDDDVDVYMLRPDYDKLMKLSDSFAEPYFLQNSMTDRYLMRSFARLRNSRTLGATVREIDLPIHRGIFIDIFPLDGITPDKKSDTVQKAYNRFMKDVCGCYNYSHGRNPDYGLPKRMKLLFYRVVAGVFAHDKMTAYRRFENNLKKYSTSGFKMWGNRTLFFDCPKSRRPLEDYQDLISMPFEMLEVPVPRKYDEMLRQQYGDYMKIPKNKGENLHGGLILSTEQSYLDYQRKREADAEKATR